MTDEAVDAEQAEQDDATPGNGLLTLDFAGTGVFVAAATIATLVPDEAARPAAVVDGILFAVGVAAFLWAYATAIGRSRTDVVGIAGLYFLSGSAPKVVRTRFYVALAVQVVVAIVSASIRPYTAVAFGILVPMLGLGLMGLWGAKHGTFPPREP